MGERGESVEKQEKNKDNFEEQIKALTLEESFEVIDGMVEKLEDAEISLEDSFQIYEQGMELLKHCNQLIDQVEKKVLIIQENGELHEFH